MVIIADAKDLGPIVAFLGNFSGFVLLCYSVTFTKRSHGWTWHFNCQITIVIFGFYKRILPRYIEPAESHTMSFFLIHIARLWIYVWSILDAYDVCHFTYFHLIIYSNVFCQGYFTSIHNIGRIFSICLVFDGIRPRLSQTDQITQWLALFCNYHGSMDIIQSRYVSKSITQQN